MAAQRNLFSPAGRASKLAAAEEEEEGRVLPASAAAVLARETLLETLPETPIRPANVLPETDPRKPAEVRRPAEDESLLRPFQPPKRRSKNSAEARKRKDDKIALDIVKGKIT